MAQPNLQEMLQQAGLWTPDMGGAPQGQPGGMPVPQMGIMDMLPQVKPLFDAATTDEKYGFICGLCEETPNSQQMAMWAPAPVY